MTSLYNAFETDTDLESGQGIMLDYGSAGSITIHRAGGNNRKYLSVLEAKLKPYRRQLQTGTLDKETDSRLMAEIYAESVIIGWKGIKDREGKALSFTKTNVVKLLLDLPEFFNEIKRQADTIGNFRREQIEEEAKNSEQS